MSPILMPQHQPGAWRCDGHVPSAEWPEDCRVQWGARGVVLCEKPYTTAFFEAFPAEPSTFIRGEGATVHGAEEDALMQWERIRSCSGHEFERRRYTNGAGVCRHCDLFLSGQFEPLPEIPHAADCACGLCQLKCALGLTDTPKNEETKNG